MKADIELPEEIIGKAKPTLDKSYSRMIAVINLPVVKEDKYDKLCTIIKKIVRGRKEPFLHLANHEHSFFMPMDETKTTKGIAFAEYVDEKEAAKAIERVSGVQLDKSHVIQAFPVSDFEQTRGVPDEFKPPEFFTYYPNERDFSWLEDERILRGCEMFATQVKIDTPKTSIGLFNPKAASSPESLFKKDSWSTLGFRWSPNGTYFVAMIPAGVVAVTLNGNPLNPETRLKMKCENPAQILFSPQERYALTCSGNPNESMQVWNIADTTSKEGKPIALLKPAPDMFAWDASERMCVRRANPATNEGKAGAVEVFDVETNRTRFIPLPGVSVVSVSPREPLAACFISEQKNQDACINIVDLNKGTVIRKQMAVKAISCNFYWHPSGRFLAAQVDSYEKGKRRVSSLTLFRMDERQIPTEIIELEVNKMQQYVKSFAWEPGFGTRFACCTGTDKSASEARDAATSKKSNVFIYDMRVYGSRATCLHTLKEKPSLDLSWSPQQGILLLRDISSVNSSVEFFDVASGKVLNSVGPIFNLNSVQWDPSGRFVAFVSAVASHTGGDAGFTICSFTGRQLYHVNEMGLSQFLWRPRPTGAYEAKDYEILRKNMPKYRKEFQLEEKEESEKSAKEAASKLQAVSNKFQELMRGLLEIHDSQAEKIRTLYGFDPNAKERFIVFEEKITESPVA